MRGAVVLRMAGALFYVFAALLAPPLALAVLDGADRAARAFLATACLATAAAVLARAAGRSAAGASVGRKDAFGVVALTWVSIGVFGALPFLFEGSIVSVTGALFESLSGLTTTGATVYADVDGLARAVNLWRCETHWIGGMGIVVLFVAVFPNVGVGGKQLFRTEATGPTSEGLKPRIKQTALRLWVIYTVMTVACGLLLWLEGMSPFDAVCHAMSTLGTGGFSTRTASLGAWSSPLIHWTVIAFMLLAGLSFGLYYTLVQGRWREVAANPELRFYLGVNLVMVAVVFVSVLRAYDGPAEAIRHSAFQVVAVTSTTGFMTDDFDRYPEVARWLLLACMFMGGSAGSTAGGLKAVRVLVLFKLAAREISIAVRPEAVVPVRIGRTALPPQVVTSVAAFFAAYMAIFVLVSAAMTVLGLDLVSAMSATVACLSSIGPGLAQVGPSQNYGAIPPVGQLLLCFCMVAGRLEVFHLVGVFSRECWRR